MTIEKLCTIYLNKEELLTVINAIEKLGLPTRKYELFKNLDDNTLIDTPLHITEPELVTIMKGLDLLHMNNSELKHYFQQCGINKFRW